MTTAYTSLLGLALPVTGELSGTWGDTVNNSITSLLDSAIAGTTTLSTDADVTLSVTTGASNTSRQAILLCTGARTGVKTITAPQMTGPTVSKIYTVINNTTGGYSVIVVGAVGTGVTIVAGESALIAWNGSDFIKISNTSGAGVFTTLSVTGVATFSAGTAALPAITTTGDTNTGIFFPAADTIAFAEGGVEAARFDSSGQLGIGTSSPTQKLQILGANPTGFVGAAIQNNNANVGIAGVQFSSDVTYFKSAIGLVRQDANGKGSIVFYNDSNADAADWATSDEKMRLDSSGNLGIGTTSPTRKLDVRQAYTADTIVAQIGNTNNGNGATPVATIFDFTEANGTSVSRISSIYTQNIGKTDLAFGTYNSGLAEKMRLDSSGNLLVGTTTANANFYVYNAPVSYAGLNTTAIFSSSASQSTGTGGLIAFEGKYTSGGALANFAAIGGLKENSTDSNYSGYLGFYTRLNGNLAAERARIDSSGNLGIGTTSPQAKLHVSNGSTENIEISPTYIQSFNRGGSPGYADLNLYANNYIFNTGNLGIGTSSPTFKLDVSGNIRGLINNASVGNASSVQLTQNGSGDAAISFLIGAATEWLAGVDNSDSDSFKINAITGGDNFNGTGLNITTGGNVSISGSLSKGSGSFRIDHPLPQLEETHQLVHSFIEGPQADLIYRGKVNLVNGTATVNIDTVSTMTEGTFVTLCRDVQCFTTNESDWTAVRGSVTGNILTIEAEDNTSTAGISWMVIGERKDKHMMDTDWTDDNGKVIVEPLKEQSSTALEGA